VRSIASPLSSKARTVIRFLHPLFAGLHIGSRHLALAVLERHRRGYHLRSARVMELPPGLIQPSPSNPNISDPAAFQHSLGELLRSEKGLKTISVSLPDPSVRAALLPVSTQTVRGSDLYSLIRWQMEKLFLSPLGHSKIVYQPVPSPRNSLLAVVVQEQILQQYEEPIRRLGIMPVWVSISSFQLFNLYHDLILQLAGPSGRFMVLNWFDHNFTLMIFMEGVLDFVRIKGLGVTVSSLAAFEPLSEGFGHSQRSQSLPAEEGLLLDLVTHELNTSLSFYNPNDALSLVTHLFVFGRKMSEFIKRVHDQYHIEVEPLEPERIPFLTGLTKIRSEEVCFVAPAIAAAIDGATQLFMHKDR